MSNAAGEDKKKKGVRGKADAVCKDGKAVRKVVARPQCLLQASRGQRQYGWSRLGMELYFSRGRDKEHGG